MSGTLKGPIRTHTGEKHYKCDVCGAHFVHSSDVDKHIRTHTGEIPFLKCDMCSAQFAHTDDLKNCTHTGVNLSKCEMCSAQCAHST